MASKGAAVRKRQQIEKASRTMFLWVALAAAVIGIATVVSMSLVERLVYNQKVINEKSQTASNLSHNNKIIDELKRNVRVRNTDAALLETPRPEGREPISVVLDALPSQANSSALGASLQQKLLNDGVSIDSLTVDPISGVEGDDSTSDLTAGDKEVGFSFTVSTDATTADKIKEVLTKLERSIRTINVKSLSIQQNSGRISLAVEGVAYYEPEVTVNLKEKQVPHEKK